MNHLKTFNEKFWPFNKKDDTFRINTDPIPGSYVITTSEGEDNITYSTWDELDKLKEKYPVGGYYLNDSLTKEYSKIRAKYAKSNSWRAPLPKGSKIIKISTKRD